MTNGGGYRDLLVWRRGMDLAEQVYVLTRSYPREEQFGLTSQTRRAAASVPANIAEGYGRGTQGAFAAFLRIARGSLREVETHLILAARVGIIRPAQVEILLVDSEEIGRMLHALIAKVRNARPAP